jgi:hypothetical protein
MHPVHAQGPARWVSKRIDEFELSVIIQQLHRAFGEIPAEKAGAYIGLIALQSDGNGAILGRLNDVSPNEALQRAKEKAYHVLKGSLEDPSPTASKLTVVAVYPGVTSKSFLERTKSAKSSSLNDGMVGPTMWALGLLAPSSVVSIHPTLQVAQLRSMNGSAAMVRVGLFAADDAEEERFSSIQSAREVIGHSLFADLSKGVTSLVVARPGDPLSHGAAKGGKGPDGQNSGKSTSTTAGKALSSSKIPRCSSSRDSIVVMCLHLATSSHSNPR